jgi:ABC-type transport system involved in cytochrome bd biosynthesis fused ATPase/permease subunit
VAFIFAIGEIGATALVAPPGESTLPVRVYTLIANTPASNLAALTLADDYRLSAACTLRLVPLSKRGRKMKEAFLRLVAVTKRYGSRAVVDRASLFVAEGEVVALLGSSGCGKNDDAAFDCGSGETR